VLTPGPDELGEWDRVICAVPDFAPALESRFDEWLMGWPKNWTMPCATGSIEFARAEMESYLSRQRSHLSRLLARSVSLTG
jgi:hypothetical protein